MNLEVKVKLKPAVKKQCVESNVVKRNVSDITYKYPPLELLDAGAENHFKVTSGYKDLTLTETKMKISEKLTSFGIKVNSIDVHRGPTVTRCEIKPASDIKLSKITTLADDIAFELAVPSVRMEAPVSGKSVVGIEIPNFERETVTLREILESDEFQNSQSKLSFAVGYDNSGNVIIDDLASLSNLIIAGSADSGKSVFMNSMIMSILYKASPDEVKLLLIDPNIVDFKVYEGIPHLFEPIKTDNEKAVGALKDAVQEMQRRYHIFSENNVRDIKRYNEIAAESSGTIESMPHIVIAVSEYSDLMAVTYDVEDKICRLAQMGRQAGIHLVIATRRPTMDVMTGLIRSNISNRIAFSVHSVVDSRTILALGGAEKLTGQGDMLYKPYSTLKPVRVQGCFCSEDEIKSVVSFIKDESVKSGYETENSDSVSADKIPSLGKLELDIDCNDELINDDLDVVIKINNVCVSR